MSRWSYHTEPEFGVFGNAPAAKIVAALARAYQADMRLAGRHQGLELGEIVDQTGLLFEVAQRTLWALKRQEAVESRAMAYLLSDDKIAELALMGGLG